MANKWILVGTNAMEFGDIRTKDEKRRDLFRQNKGFKRQMAKTEKRSYEKMIEDAERSYLAAEVNKINLLQAFSEKKLKSKALINQARGLRKRQKQEEENAVATV